MASKKFLKAFADKNTETVIFAMAAILKATNKSTVRKEHTAQEFNGGKENFLMLADAIFSQVEKTATQTIIDLYGYAATKSYGLELDTDEKPQEAAIKKEHDAFMCELQLADRVKNMYLDTNLTFEECLAIVEKEVGGIIEMKWTTTETKKIKDLAATSTIQELIEAFPYRTETQIRNKLAALKLDYVKCEKSFKNRNELIQADLMQFAYTYQYFIDLYGISRKALEVIIPKLNWECNGGNICYPIDHIFNSRSN